MDKKLINYFEKAVVLKTSELELKNINRVYLTRLVQKGVLQSVARGYYSLPKYDIFKSLLVLVSKYYKSAVISGLAAASFYKLTDESIDKIDIDVPNSLNIRNSFLKVKRTQKSKIIGCKLVKIYNKSVKIYEPERLLIEIKSRYPLSIFFKVLKKYIANYNCDYSKIKKYDKIFSSNVLEYIMQELADA